MPALSRADLPAPEAPMIMMAALRSSQMCGESLTATVDKSGFGCSYGTNRQYRRATIAGEESRVVWSLAKDPLTKRISEKMGIFRRKVPRHYIPIHPDNIATKDWIVLLEAGTIVGCSAEKLRVATATLERKIVTKYNILLNKKHFLILEGYDPRIHALYFCPQLYKLDSENKPVAIDGQEIGQLLAQSVRDGVVEKQPWYEPSDSVPGEPIIATTAKANFDSLIVDEPTPLKSAA
jgi:hypothetical protein